jgi:hypothetical protein
VLRVAKAAPPRRIQTHDAVRWPPGLTPLVKLHRRRALSSLFGRYSGVTAAVWIEAVGRSARLDLLVTSFPPEAWILLSEDQAELDLEQLLERLSAAEQRCALLLAELEQARMAQDQLQRYADDLRRTYAESHHRLQQMTVLHEVSTTVDPSEVLSRGAAGLERLSPGR